MRSVAPPSPPPPVPPRPIVFARVWSQSAPGPPTPTSSGVPGRSVIVAVTTAPSPPTAWKHWPPRAPTATIVTRSTPVGTVNSYAPGERNLVVVVVAAAADLAAKRRIARALAAPTPHARQQPESFTPMRPRCARRGSRAIHPYPVTRDSGTPARA